jgi:uncharacterized membrane protein HdeD (DUF308 family)
VSDIPVPDASDTSAQARSREVAGQLARSWWLFLILGVLWILFGMFVLSYNVGSLLALAAFVAATFIATGITQLLAAGRVDSWRWLFLIGGIVSILAGIVAIVWPGRTLLVLSLLIAWFLVFKGIVDVVSALANTHRDWWWVGLLLGVAEFLLGIWAVGYPGRSLFVFVNLVGIYALFLGFSEIFAAFALRNAAGAADRRRPDAPRPAV